MKAIRQNAILAESDRTIVVEGNHYFPSGSVNKDYLTESDKHSICPWKGTGSCYDVNVNGEINNNNTAWTYPEPKDDWWKIVIVIFKPKEERV